MTVNTEAAADRCRCPGAGLGRGSCPGRRWGWARHSRPPTARGLSYTEVRQVPERPRPAPRTDAGRAARWHSALPLLKVTHSAIARGSHAQQDGAEPVFPLADGAAGVRPNRGAELLLSGVPPEPRVRGLILGGAGQAGPWKGYLVSAWVPDPLDPRPESGWGCHAGFGAGKRLVTQPRPVKCVGLSPSPHRRRPQRCCFSATALAAPCPHGAFVLFWLFAAGHSLPPPHQPLPGTRPGAASQGVSWASLGAPSLGAWAAREFPGPLVLLGSPPSSPSQPGSSPQVRAWLPGLGGAPAGAGSSGLGCVPAAAGGGGGCAARSRARSVGCRPEAPPACSLSAWATQGARAHGGGWHMGGGRPLPGAEGARAGTAVLAGPGLRASPQGPPLWAAVLRRWVPVAARGVGAGGAPVSQGTASAGKGWCPAQV